MSQYKIQVGSWTKLPDGRVQEDTRDIMEMMADKIGGQVEGYVAKVGSFWKHLGVAEHCCVLVYDSNHPDCDLAIKPSLFIPYEELQKMLKTPEGLPTVQDIPKVTSLLNTKLDCRKSDGSVDEELSRAFQEACFEQGIKWGGQLIKIKHLDKPFLFTDSGDNSITIGGFEDEVYFNNNMRKEINFTYSRKLEWEATIVEPEPVDEMVDICGVEYSAKELREALALIKSARKG